MKNLLLKIQSHIPSFLKNEEGATMVEYALMVALIAVVSIVVITGLGTAVSSTFGIVSNSMTNAVAG